jgi:hypothetical protein
VSWVHDTIVWNQISAHNNNDCKCSLVFTDLASVRGLYQDGDASVASTVKVKMEPARELAWEWL